MWKYFFVILLPAAALLGAAMGYIHHVESASDLALTETREKEDIRLKIGTSEVTFMHLHSDLMFLAEQHELETKLSVPDYPPDDLVKDYITFARIKGLYDQIRLIDEHGMELVRVNYNNGRPIVVRDEDLQDKSGRYYFSETMKLGKGEIYLSPFDLNIEHGEIELPFKPMIRLATPVYDTENRKRGIVIVNFLGRIMLDGLKGTGIRGMRQIMLLNADGFFLLAPNTENEWGFMLEERKERKFQKTFPAEWQKIYAAESGQFYSKDGLFTFGTIYPLKMLSDAHFFSSALPVKSGKSMRGESYFWKIVSFVPSGALFADTRNLMRELVRLYVMVLFILGIGAFFLARATQRRRAAEMEIRESEDRFHKLADATMEGVAVHKEMEIIDANRMFLSMFGYNKFEISGMNILDFVAPESEELVRGKIDTGDETSYELINLRKDNTRFTGEACGKTISFGGETARVVVIRDITRYKETERMLRERNREIQDLIATLEKRIEEEVALSRQKDFMMIQQSRHASMGEMISYIAHQWRQPLNALGLLLANIRYDFLDGEMSREDLELYISKGNALIEKMSKTIDDFRDFFRPERDKEEFSPARAVRDILAIVEDSFRYKNIAITVREEGDVAVLGFPNEYSQVILNILSNAGDAITESGVEGGRIMINIGTGGDDGGSVVSITDNGGGIPDRIMDRIFDPYFSAKKGGTGIGLYMSRMIIEEIMGGKIEAGNVEGGAQFRICLPAAGFSQHSERV